MSEARICSDNCTCCHTETAAADRTCYLTQSQSTDAGPARPSTDRIRPAAWQGSHWSTSVEVSGMSGRGKLPTGRAGLAPGPASLQAHTLPLGHRGAGNMDVSGKQGHDRTLGDKEGPSFSFPVVSRDCISQVCVIIAFPRSVLSLSFPGLCHHCLSQVCVIIVFPRSVSSLPFPVLSHHCLSQVCVIIVFPSSLSSLSFPVLCHHCLSQVCVIIAFPRSVSSLPFPGLCHHCLSQVCVIIAFPRSVSSSFRVVFHHRLYNERVSRALFHVKHAQLR